MPSSLSPSTISVGYSSACSSSVATGMISLVDELPDRLEDLGLVVGESVGLAQACHQQGS